MRTVGVHRCRTVIVLRRVDDNESALVIKATLDHDPTQHVFAPELLQWVPTQGMRGGFAEHAHHAPQFFIPWPHRRWWLVHGLGVFDFDGNESFVPRQGCAGHENVERRVVVGKGGIASSEGVRNFV